MKRWLLVFALAVVVGHHIGVGLGQLGDIGDTGTRWADWVDVLVPYLVVGSAAMTLVCAGTDRTGWGVFVVSAVAYAQGHGIHLAANSVNNAVGGHVAHLWDEEVSHWIWYAGLTGLVFTVTRALSQLTIPTWAWLVVVLFGFTWFDNTIEGGVPWLGIAVSVLLGGYALRRRLLPIAAAYGVALLLLVIWGIWHQGFPQFSQLGWI